MPDTVGRPKHEVPDPYYVQLLGGVYLDPVSSVQDAPEGTVVPLLLDSKGRVITAGGAGGGGGEVEGVNSSHERATANPVIVGAVVDDIFPRTAAEGDARYIRVTPRGELKVALFTADGDPVSLGKTPSMSDTLASVGTLAADERTTREVVKGVSGKRIRVISFVCHNLSSGLGAVSAWFGTTSQVAVGSTTRVTTFHVGGNNNLWQSMVWPAGEGPVGPAGAGVVFKAENNVGGDKVVGAICHYRTEDP